jgi:hypothetical protein
MSYGDIQYKSDIELLNREVQARLGSSNSLNSRFSEIKDIIINSKTRLIVYLIGLIACWYIFLWQTAPDLVKTQTYSVATGTYMKTIDQKSLIGYSLLFSIVSFLVSSVVLYKYFPKYRHFLFKNCEYCI